MRLELKIGCWYWRPGLGEQAVRGLEKGRVGVEGSSQPIGFKVTRHRVWSKYSSAAFHCRHSALVLVRLRY